MKIDHLQIIKTFCSSNLKEEVLVERLNLDSLPKRDLIELLNLIEKEVEVSTEEVYDRLESLAYEILFILEKREKGWIVL